MSQIEVKDLSNCKKQISLQIPAETMQTIREQEIKKIQKTAQMPGFRKGKAPKSMVIKNYAANIEQNTADEAINQAYKKVLDENKFNPIDSPMVTDIKYDNDRNLVVVLEVESFPEIELKNYKNIKLKKTVYKVEEKDVDAVFESMKHEKATITPIEDGAKDGHIVKMEMQELDEQGVPLIGKKYSDFRVQLGLGKFDKEIEKQLIGVKVGEERRIEKVYAEKDPDKKLAGKKENYLVKIESVEEEILPEINDDFIKELKVDVKTVKEMREKVKHNLEHSFADKAAQLFYNQLAHELLQENPFEIPEKMVNDYLDRIVEDIKNKDKSIDEETVRKNYKTEATFNMKWFYLKNKIADVEEIKITDTDIEKYLQSIEDEKMRDLFSTNPEWKQRISGDLAEKKITDFLIENQKVTETIESVK